MKHTKMFRIICLASLPALTITTAVTHGGIGSAVGGVNLSAGIKKPHLIIGKSANEVAAELRGAPNSDLRQSGLKLANYYTQPFARELVWAYNLTEPMPLVFTSEGWLKGDPTLRTVRMYYHVAFDETGKAVAAAQWYKGPFGPPPNRPTERSQQRPERPIPPPTHWGFNFSRTVREYGGVPTVSHWDVKDRRPGDKPGRLLPPTTGQAKLSPARRPDGSYGQAAFAMANGRNWAIVGRAYPVLGQTAACFILPTGPAVGELLLIMAWFEGREPVYGKILPTTNDQATKQDGVK